METEDQFIARIQRRGVPVGSHLVVERRVKPGLRVYTHHGIYVGRGMVAHYSGWATGMFVKGRICRVRFAEFARGRRIGIRRYENPSPRDVVLRRVAEMERRQPDYDLLRSNCEHFATYCATGEHRSKQAFRVVWFGLIGQLVSEALSRE